MELVHQGKVKWVKEAREVNDKRRERGRADENCKICSTSRDFFSLHFVESTPTRILETTSPLFQYWM